jgi:hypothetical protein
MLDKILDAMAYTIGVPCSFFRLMFNMYMCLWFPSFIIFSFFMYNSVISI